MVQHTFCVVVARYNENVDWTSQIDASSLIIYDKSPTPLAGAVSRRNKGREVASFLEYVITNYNALPDYTLFCQGDPFPHMGPHVNARNIGQHILELANTEILTTEPLFTGTHVEGHGMYPLRVRDYYSLFFDTPAPSHWRFAAGCQYVIPKACVLARPKSFYQRVHTMTLLGDKHNAHGAHNGAIVFDPYEISGWTLERLLGTIFSDTPLRPEMENGKQYLVTGGAGFIGSNLVQTLAARPYTSVYVLDNFSTGSVRVERPNVRIVEGDILHQDDLKLVGFVDGIFHLAAMSKVAPSLANIDMADFCLEQNAQGTLSVLKYAHYHSPPVKVVYSASSTVYGNNPAPQVETQLPACQTPYAMSKYCGELVCELFSTLYQVPTVRLRYFMVFGPGEPSSGAYAIVTGIFRRRQEAGLPLEIHGDGLQSRDFVHVDDVVKANMAAMDNASLVNETINVGTGETVTIQALADSISPLQVHTEKRKVDLQCTMADTQRMQELLGFVGENSILQV